MTDFSYRGINFRTHGPAANPTDIATMEQELGARLPNDFRQFLFASDGGMIESNRGVLVSIRKQTPRLIEFLCFYELKEIPIALRGYDFIQRVPDLIIPLGRFTNDCMPCVSLREKDYGHIYIWAPRELWNTEDEVLVQTKRDIFFLANSFNAFLDLLQPIPEER